MSSTRVLSSDYTAHPTRQQPNEKSAADPTAARCYQQPPIMSIAMTTTAVPEDDVMNEESNSPPSSSISTSSSSLCSNIINRSVEQHSKDGLSIINGNKKSCFNNPDNIIDKNSCFTDKSNQLATADSNDSKSSDTSLKDTSDRPVKKNKVMHSFTNGHLVTDSNQTADPSNIHSQSSFSNLDAKITSSTDMVKSNAFSISQTLNNKCNNNNITNINGVFDQKHQQQQQQKRKNCYISSTSTLLPSSSLAHMNSPPTYANINTFNTNQNLNNFTLSSTNVTNDSNKDINSLNTVSSATTVSRDWAQGPEQTTSLTVTKSLPLSINLSSATSPPLYDASSDNQKMVVHKGPNSNDTKDNSNSLTYMNRNAVEDQLTFLASVSSPLSPFNFSSHYGGPGGLTLPSVGSPIGMNSTGGFATHQTHQQQAYYNNINSFYTNLLFQQQQHNPNLNPKINSSIPSNSIKDIPNHFNNSTNNNLLQGFYPNFSGGCQYSYPHPNNINTSSNSNNNNNNNNNTSLESSAVVETRFESSASGYRGQSPPVAVSVTTATAAVAMTTTSTNNGGTAAAVKRTRQTSHKFKNEMCRVCGDKASGYHYKAITCEGCKVFFLRCVATNAQFNACHSGGSCEMDLYTRRKCQYCRFAKCLAIGMKPECVILDRQKSSLAARSAHAHTNAASTNKMTNNNLMHNGTTPSSSLLVNSPHTPLTPPTTLNDGQALDNAARNGMGYKTAKGNANTSLVPGANGKISALSIIQAAKQKAALLGPLTPNIVGEINGVNNNNNTDLGYKNAPTTELTSKSTTINNSSLNKKLNHLTNGKHGIGNGKTNNRQNHTKGHTHQAVNQSIPTSSLHHRHNNQYVGGHTNGIDFGADTNFYLEESYKNSRVVNGLGLQQQRPIMSQMVSPSLGTSCYVNGGGIFSQHPNFMLNGNIPTPNAYNSMNVNGGGINTINTINNQFPLIDETAMAHSIMASSGGCRPTTHKTERENNGDAEDRLTFTLYNDETNNYHANNNNQSMKQLTNGYDSNETNNKLTSPFMINHTNGIDNSNDNLYTDPYLKPDTLNYHNGNGSRKAQEVLHTTSPLYHENNKFSNNNNINDYNGTVGENKQPTNYNQPLTNGNLYESIGGLSEFHTNNSPLQAYPLKSEQKRLVERLVFYQDQFELPSAEVVKSIEEYSEQDTKSNANQKTFMKMAQFGMLNIQLIIEFSKRLPGFQSLLRQDQITILKACMYEIMLIKTARRYDLNTDTIVCCDNKPYTRDNFKNSGIVDVCDSMFDFCRGMATLKVDNAEYALLTAVCLFQERPALIEPKKVESIQEYYSDTLRSYVQARRPSGSNTLARLLVKLRDLREINNSHSSMLYSLKVQNFHIPPLMAEVWDLNSIGTPTTTVENVSSNESFNSNKPLLLVNDDQMNSNSNPNPNNKGNKNVEKGTCFFVGGSHPSSENNGSSKTEKVQNLHEVYANYQFIETESPSALYKDVMHHQPTSVNNLPSENGVSKDETHQTKNHCYDTFNFREGHTSNHQTKETKFTGHVNNQQDCLKHNMNNFSPKANDSTPNGAYNHVENNNQNLNNNENIQSNQYFNHLSPNISHTAFGKNENKNNFDNSCTPPITNHKRKHSSP